MANGGGGLYEVYERNLLNDNFVVSNLTYGCQIWRFTTRKFIERMVKTWQIIALRTQFNMFYCSVWPVSYAIVEVDLYHNNGSYRSYCITCLMRTVKFIGKFSAKQKMTLNCSAL